MKPAEQVTCAYSPGGWPCWEGVRWPRPSADRWTSKPCGPLERMSGTGEVSFEDKWKRPMEISTYLTVIVISCFIKLLM